MFDQSVKYRLVSSIVSCEFFYHTSVKGKRTCRYFAVCVSFVIRVSLTLETGNRERTFLPISRDFRERVAFCTSVLVRATCRWNWVWSIGGVILNGEYRSARINTYPSLNLMVTPCINNIHHFNNQLTHRTLKNVELLKHFKISKTVPTCFGLQGNHHQRATIIT